MTKQELLDKFDKYAYLAEKASKSWDVEDNQAIVELRSFIEAHGGEAEVGDEERGSLLAWFEEVVEACKPLFDSVDEPVTKIRALIRQKRAVSREQLKKFIIQVYGMVKAGRFEIEFPETFKRFFDYSIDEILEEQKE